MDNEELKKLDREKAKVHDELREAWERYDFWETRVLVLSKRRTDLIDKIHSLVKESKDA